MNNQTALEEQLKKFIIGVYLTGYDQGYHESGDDKELKAFETFWDSMNRSTWKDQLMALIDTAVQKAVPEKMKHCYLNGEQRKDICNSCQAFNDLVDLFQSNWEKVKKGIADADALGGGKE